MHLSRHQKLLRMAVGRQLDSVIARIRFENPSAFHVERTSGSVIETLSTRDFFDQPMRREPCRRFLRPCVRHAETSEKTQVVVEDGAQKADVAPI